MDQNNTVDPFGGLSQSVDPFAGVAQKDQPVAEPTAKLTPYLGALAQTDPMSITHPGALADISADIQKQIESVGSDAQLRAAAAAKAVQEDPVVQTVNRMGFGAVAAGQKYVADLDAAKQEYALEEQAIERIHQVAASGDETQAQIMLTNMQRGGPEKYLTDINTKQLILQREIEKAGVAAGEQSWASDFLYFMASCIPLTNSTAQVGNVDLPGMTHRSWLDSVFTGKRSLEESSALFRLTPDQFSKYVREQLIPNVQKSSTFAGLTDKGKILNILSDMQSPQDVTEKNTMNALDNVGLVGAVKPLAKAVSVPYLLLKNGARTAATSVVVDTALAAAREGTEAAAKRSGTTVDEVVDNLLHSATNPNGVAAPVVPLATDASQALSGAQQLLDSMPQLVGTGRLTDSETAAAIKHFQDKISTQLGDYVKDIGPAEPYKSPTGQLTSQIEVTLGKRTNGGYKTPEALQRYAGSLGYTVTPVQDQSGQWFGKIKLSVPETGFYTSPLTPRVSGPVDAYLRSGRNLSDPVLADMAVAAGNTQNAIKAHVINPLVESITALGADQKKALGQVLSKGRAERKWYSPSELGALYTRTFGRMPEAAELKAYQAARDVNDIEYLLRNEDMWGSKVRKGYQTTSFDITPDFSVKRENALVEMELSGSPKYRTYDVVSGQHFKEGLTDEQLEALKAEGRALVRTERPIELPDGTTVNSFLVNKKALKVEDLRHDQIPYNAGGHTIYTGKYFPKQADYLLQPDAPNRKVLRNPNVYGAFDTKAQADWWVSNMEKARQLYNEGGAKAAEAIEKATALGSHKALPTGQEFVEGVQRGLWKPDMPFTSCYDREMPLEYNKVDADALTFVDREEGGLDGYMRTNGRLYYGRRGEQLQDFMGNEASVLDPYETINRSLASVAKLSSFGDYKEASMSRWVETYKDYLKNFDPNKSPTKLFQEGVFADHAGPHMDRIRQQAETQREIINRTLGWKTPTDRAADQYVMRLADFVAGSDPNNTARNTMAKYINNWWETKSPINFIRGFAFNMKLGLFNPAQFLLQAVGAINSATIAGFERGSRAMMTALPLRMYLMKAGTDDLLETFINRGVHERAGFADAKEFKAFMNHMKTSGFFDFSTSHLLINSNGPDAAYSAFGSKLSQIAEAGRFFFNEGETWNRLVSARLAWDDAKEALPDAAFSSQAFLRKWAGRAEDWSMQMSATSQAKWQSGLMSIPTQFWAYNARMAEALLGNTFTPQQRIRLAIAQLGFAGAAGLPITYEIAHQYERITGNTNVENMDTFEGVVKRGLLDSMIYHATGADVQVGERVGTGNFISDTVRDIFGYSAMGEKNAADVLGGASYSTLTSFFGGLSDVASWAIAESGGDPKAPIDMTSVLHLASNVSSVNNLAKAYMVFKYNTLMSGKGTVLAADVPTVNGFAQALGFSSGKALSAADMQLYLKDKKQMVNDLSNQIINLRTKAFVTDQNPVDYYPQVNLLMKMYPEDVRIQAIQKAQRSSSGGALYDVVAKRYELNRTKEAMLNNGDEQ